VNVPARKQPYSLVYDAVVKRWRALCHDCGYQAVRAGRDNAEHVMAQHCAYKHDRN